MATLGMVFSLVSFVLAIIILISAFKQSVGIGFACLCIPFVIFWFAFARFEHEKKNMIVWGMIGSWILGIALSVAGGAAMPGGMG